MHLATNSFLAQKSHFCCNPNSFPGFHRNSREKAGILQNRLSTLEGRSAVFGKWRFQRAFLSKFEFESSPFGFVKQNFVQYCAAWRSTNSIQFKIYRFIMMTTCHVLYLSDVSIRTQISCEFSFTESIGEARDGPLPEWWGCGCIHRS